MKKIYSIVSIVCALMFVSCFEVEEKTIFKTVETGEYSLTVDMGGMIAQLKMFGGADKLRDLQIKDSIGYFKNIIEKDTSLTSIEKDAIRDGYMQIRFNEDAEEMKIILFAPFKNIEHLKLMRSALSKVVANNNKMPMPGFNASQKPGGLNVVQMESFGFVLNTEKGTISNTLSDADLLKRNLEADATLQQLRQYAPMMGSPGVYKTVYSFPTAIKSFKAVNGTMSEDKKTVIIKNEFEELFENPKAFEFTINY